MKRVLTAGAMGLLLLSASLAGQRAGDPSPRIHRLEATPDTVAYGYYWADAKPALRIASQPESEPGTAPVTTAGLDNVIDQRLQMVDVATHGQLPEVRDQARANERSRLVGAALDSVTAQPTSHEPSS